MGFLGTAIGIGSGGKVEPTDVGALLSAFAMPTGVIAGTETPVNAAIVAWWRGDLGVTLNGSNVSTWADQSGGGHDLTQGTPANQIPYVSTGLKYLSYGHGTHQQLINTSLNLSQPFEMFFVVQSTDGSLASVCDWGSPNNNNTVYRSAATTLTLYPQTASVTVSQSTIHVIDALCDGAKGSIAVDDGSASGGSVSHGTAGTGFSLGNRYDDVTQAWGGYIYEVILYDRALTTGERTDLNAYLLARYGVS